MIFNFSLFLIIFRHNWSVGRLQPTGQPRTIGRGAGKEREPMTGHTVNVAENDTIHPSPHSPLNNLDLGRPVTGSQSETLYPRSLLRGCPCWVCPWAPLWRCSWVAACPRSVTTRGVRPWPRPLRGFSWKDLIQWQIRISLAGFPLAMNRASDRDSLIGPIFALSFTNWAETRRRVSVVGSNSLPTSLLGTRVTVTGGKHQ